MIMPTIAYIIMNCDMNLVKLFSQLFCNKYLLNFTTLFYSVRHTMVAQIGFKIIYI